MKLILDKRVQRDCKIEIAKVERDSKTRRGGMGDRLDKDLLAAKNSTL